MGNRFVRRKYIPIYVIVVIVLGVLIFHLTDDSGNKKPVAKAHSNTPSVVAIAPSGIVYPSSWTEASQISASDEQAGVISVASQQSSAVTVVIREQADKLAQNFNINALPAQVVASLSSDVSGFTLLNQSVTQIQSYKAVEVNYTSTGSNSQTYANEMYIVPTPNVTYYITYSSSKGSLTSQQSDIDTINTSVASYIKTHTS